MPWTPCSFQAMKPPRIPVGRPAVSPGLACRRCRHHATGSRCLGPWSWSSPAGRSCWSWRPVAESSWEARWSMTVAPSMMVAAWPATLRASARSAPWLWGTPGGEVQCWTATAAWWQEARWRLGPPRSSASGSPAGQGDRPAGRRAPLWEQPLEQPEPPRARECDERRLRCVSPIRAPTSSQPPGVATRAGRPRRAPGAPSSGRPGGTQWRSAETPPRGAPGESRGHSCARPRMRRTDMRMQPACAQRGARCESAWVR